MNLEFGLEETLHLCHTCIHKDTCEEVREYPILDCPDFVDEYEGPEYYDGDAWREYMNVSLFGGRPVGHGD